MNPNFHWLLVGLGAAGFAGWRLVVSRRRAAALRASRAAAAAVALELARQAARKAAAPAMPVTAPTAGRPPDGVERRSPGRLQADRVIAAEAARRQAALQKSQDIARAEATRRRAPSGQAAQPAVPMRAKTADATPPTPRPTSAPSVVAFRPAAPAAAAPRPAATVKTPAQTLILLADDSKMVRLKTSRLLAAHDFQIITAVDGLDAVKQLEGRLPDLVITDVDMPGMDGFGLANHLRGTARTAHIPVVMITSAEDRHREEAHRIGVGLVMGKPYAEDELIAHIRSFAFPATAELAPAAALG